MLSAMVSGAKFFLQKVFQHYRNGFVSAAMGPGESNERLQKQWKFWERH